MELNYKTSPRFYTPIDESSYEKSVYMKQRYEEARQKLTNYKTLIKQCKRK